VVTRAQRVLGDTRAVAVEVAQIRGALGQWETSALAWREAMMGHDGVDDAAVYGLKLAPLARRDGVINALTMPPVLPMSRQVAASLLLEWGRARDAWAQLSPLPRSAASVAVWRRFADEAQRRDAPLAARDALVSVLESGITAELALQAAELSLQGGDAAVALDLTEVALRGADAASVSARRAVLRVRALTVLGRMDEAEREAAAMTMDPSGRRSVAAALARGWALRGDIGRARQTLRAADVHADEDPAAAWIALWSGDLATARSGFRASGERSASASSVLALLSRTKTDSSANVGAAYLALARGDTAKAVTSFVLAARSVADAAPFLQLAAARLAANRRDDATSVVQWRTILEESPTAPEAAEADLEWARQLRRTGQVTQAKTRLEHLILTYPQSALVPQARRELERAEGRVP
jgi:TolA-binding protein